MDIVGIQVGKMDVLYQYNASFGVLTGSNRSCLYV